MMRFRGLGIVLGLRRSHLAAFEPQLGKVGEDERDDT